MLRPLAWNIGFAIGHPEIDAQHRQLVALINDVIAAVERHALEDLPAMLSGLSHLAAEHFRGEIAALRELGTSTHHGAKGRPANFRLRKALAELRIDEHEAHHAHLLNGLQMLHALSPLDLCGQLKGWFVDHAIKHDARLRAVFQAI